jgi:aerobic carbon-monoxide dehydrogenase medium subunit
MILRPFQYLPCGTAAEAAARLEQHGDDAMLISGGTVVVPMMKHRIAEPAVLVSLSEAAGLRGITLENGSLRIGALATHSDIAGSDLVRANAPLLAQACGRVASPVIRSMGTIGGNLSYAESASDPPPALLALDAVAVIEGATMQRRVALREFFAGFYETVLGPSEVLTEVIVPAVPGGTQQRYHKWTPRAREDKPLVGLAVLLHRADGRCADVRLALGGVCPTPVLLRQAAAALAGAPLTRPTIAAAARAAAAEVEPFDDLQASAGYRRDMVEVWLARVLEDMARRPA